MFSGLSKLRSEGGGEEAPKNAALQDYLVSYGIHED
jgi:hypothetical protein